jgi:hypothetical protein
VGLSVILRGFRRFRRISAIGITECTHPWINTDIKKAYQKEEQGTQKSKENKEGKG